MFTDSHCHLDFPELLQNLPQVLQRMRLAKVERALCIAVQLETFPGVLALAQEYPQLWATVGVHPDYENIQEPTESELLRLAQHPRVLAIGETGLDYFRLQGDLTWQRQRFCTHIRAANQCHKPLIVHTRAAGQDTLRLLREENASACGGVIHCFTETLEFAREVLDLGFYISFSGIVTFKNAAALREVLRFVPLNRILIETDSPYLAPVPHRGKTNEPGFVPLVAACVAQEKGITLENVARATTQNFDVLFGF